MTKTIYAVYYDDGNKEWAVYHYCATEKLAQKKLDELKHPNANIKDGHDKKYLKVVDFPVLDEEVENKND